MESRIAGIKTYSPSQNKVKRCCRQPRPGHVLGTMTKWPAEKTHSQHNKMQQKVKTAKPPNHRSPQGGENPQLFFSSFKPHLFQTLLFQ